MGEIPKGGIMRGPSYWIHRLAKGMHNLGNTSRVSLEEYEDGLQRIAKNNRNERFLSDSNEHAKLVIELIASRAKDGDEVLIYTSTLPAFYDVALRNPKCKFRILVDSIDGMNAVRILCSEVSHRIDCRFAHVPEGKHFISLGCAYWMAVDHDSELVGISNFNEPEAVQRLQSRFERMWECSATHIESFI